MKINELLKASANKNIGENTAGAIASVVNPGAAVKSKKRGKIAKNALDSKDSLFGGKTVRR